MAVRVVNLVTPTFGLVFSGITHRLYSLLTGWNDPDISLDLFGTPIRPLNLNTGERVYRLPPGSLWSNPASLSRADSIRWSLQLLNMLVARRGEYDIVHFHSLSWGTLVSPLILHPLGKKVVFTMSLFGSDNPSHVRRQPRGRWQVALLRFFDGFIGVSPALADDAREQGLHNVICLPNFLAIHQLELPTTPDTRAAARLNLDIPPDKQVLLFVGSIIRRKGVDVLLDAFIKLAKQNQDLWLLMVGPQSKTEDNSIDNIYVAQQKQKIQQSGLDTRVLWAGMVNEQSLLVNYYRAADIFVFPTRNEGSPNVLTEARAAGLPVVASFLPGITDHLVSDSESGFLVEPDSPVQLAHAIDHILKDDEKRVAMGAFGRRIALEKFGFASYCQQLKTFYLGLFNQV